MSDEIRFYKGRHRVKILSKSHGHWVIETLEPFEDCVYGKTTNVKIGEKRIVAPNLLFKRKGLQSPIKEHSYELEMEKKLKKLIEHENEKQKKS